MAKAPKETKEVEVVNEAKMLTEVLPTLEDETKAAKTEKETPKKSKILDEIKKLEDATLAALRWHRG